MAMDDYQRRRLLMISDELTKQELGKLLYLTSKIPLARAERIEEGYQYFRELEQQDLLGPGRYGYLEENLKYIGRADLSKKLQSQIPYTPASLSRSQQIAVIQSKRQKYADVMTKIYMHERHCSCKRVISTLYYGFKQVWNLDTAIPFEASGCNPATISKTLQSISSFLQAYLAHKRIVLDSKRAGRLSEEIEPWSAECSRSIESFQRQVQKQGNYPGKHKMKSTENVLQIPVYEACEAILDICSSFEASGMEIIESKAVETRQTLSVIMSCTDSTHQWFPMFQWMGNLICSAIANTSPQIDLSQCHSQLEEIVSEHRENIITSYDTLLHIVGPDIMEKVAPVLQIPNLDCESDKPHSHRTTDATSASPYNHPQTISIPWYTFLLILMGLVFKCPINLAEVSQRLADYSFNDKTYENQTKACEMSLMNMVCAMHKEVDNLREAVELHSNGSPAIKELLHVPKV